MKVKVTDKVQGKLYLPASGMDYPVGTIVELDDEQFFDTTTQTAISGGFLDVIEGAKDGEEEGKFFVNKYKNAVTIKSINMTVDTGTEFFVSTKNMKNPEIQQAINLGYIVESENKNHDNNDNNDNNDNLDQDETHSYKTEDSKDKIEAKKTSSKKKSSSKKSSKKSSSKKSGSKKSSKSQKKTTQSKSKQKKSESENVRVVKKPSSESAEGEPEAVDPNRDSSETRLPDEQKMEAPKGMHAHDPNNEGVSMRVASKPEGSPETEPSSNTEQSDNSDIIFVEDGTPDVLEKSFVDAEQEQERINQRKNRNKKSNNNEVS